MSSRDGSRARSARFRQVHTRLNVHSYASRFWEAIDTPLSLSCWLLAKHGEWRQLVEKSINPADYRDPRGFFLDYQAVKLCSKYPYLETGIDRELVAKKKFLEAEIKCRLTNSSIRDGSYVRNERVGRVIFTAQRKIASILGDVPSLSELDFSFGPGASYGVRKDTSVYRKLQAAFECTPAFAGTVSSFFEEFPGWIPEGIQDVSLIPGSQLTVVPKNAKTDRTICIEPLLNGLYQKGVGSYLKRRLLRHGVDLSDQSVNQKLAGEAIEKSLATVDFASASDTIAYNLVLELLPIDWFEFLNVARSARYEADGVWYDFHKFTSMGNAYTFELETLIFYALATACCVEMGIPYSTQENLSVYGDDVIIPRGAFDLFQEVAEACGFAINTEKSFTQGQFFESCGHDFFEGHFVRPFQLSSKLNTLSAAFYAANIIKRFFQRLRAVPQGRSGVCLDDHHKNRFIDFHDWVVGCIHPRNRAVGPEGYGDGHLIGAQSPNHYRHPSWDGWWFRTLVDRPRAVKLGDVPIAYANYFTRSQLREELKRQAETSGLPFKLVEQLPSLDSGESYSVRGAVRPTWVKIFCHFIWQDISWDA